MNLKKSVLMILALGSTVALSGVSAFADDCWNDGGTIIDCNSLGQDITSLYTMIDTSYYQGYSYVHLDPANGFDSGFSEDADKAKVYGDNTIVASFQNMNVIYRDGQDVGSELYTTDSNGNGCQQNYDSNGNETYNSCGLTAVLTTINSGGQVSGNQFANHGALAASPDETSKKPVTDQPFDLPSPPVTSTFFQTTPPAVVTTNSAATVVPSAPSTFVPSPAPVVAPVTPETNCSTMVTGLYVSMLNRMPEADGLAYWSGQCVAGVTQAQITQAISNSAEYQTKHSVQNIASSILDNGGGSSNPHSLINGVCYITTNNGTLVQTQDQYCQ